jgi:hypothetical protein
VLTAAGAAGVVATGAATVVGMQPAVMTAVALVAMQNAQYEMQEGRTAG